VASAEALQAEDRVAVDVRGTCVYDSIARPHLVRLLMDAI